MDTFNLIISTIEFIIWGGFVYIYLEVLNKQRKILENQDNLLNTISDMEDRISELETDITTMQTHTTNAMSALWDEHKEHKHNYEFKDGILYIKEPV